MHGAAIMGWLVSLKISYHSKLNRLMKGNHNNINGCENML